MGRVLAKLAIVAIWVSVAYGCATPIPSADAIRALPAASPPRDTAAMPDTSVAAVTPPGFISFCVRFADQCDAPQHAPSTVALTESAWRTMQQVNAASNAAIWAEDDAVHYGRAEYWTIPTDGYGDCEDYALAKRKELIAAGFPEPALRIAIVVTPREARHAVLTVVTDKGDFVLDNLRNDVVAWNAAGYNWIERQDPMRPLGWVSLQQPATMVAIGDASIQPRAAGETMAGPR